MTDFSKPQSAHDVPGLGDRRTTALRIHGATDWWFYPLLFVIAAGLVLASLGFEVFSSGAAAQKGVRDGRTFVYDAATLAAGIEASGEHLRHVTRDLGVTARAVRVGVRPGQGGPAAGGKGAILLLDPADAAAFVGKPVHVEVSVRKISVTSAAALSVGLQNSANTVWATAPVPAENAVMVFDLPATAGPPPRGLELWVTNDKTDYNYGVEITRIAVTPAQ